jgi:hypothetical protein
MMKTNKIKSVLFALLYTLRRFEFLVNNCAEKLGLERFIKFSSARGN